MNATFCCRVVRFCESRQTKSVPEEASAYKVRADWSMPYNAGVKDVAGLRWELVVLLRMLIAQLRENNNYPLCLLHFVGGCSCYSALKSKL